MSSSIQRFEDLNTWQEGMKITSTIYKLFVNCKDFSFRDQIRRSAVSIPSNIAEGYERQSNKEFIQYLFIAKGSAAELRTQLYLAKDFKYLNAKAATELIEQSRKISAMLAKLIKSRKENF
jgi:four helix bundle protein